MPSWSQRSSASVSQMSKVPESPFLATVLARQSWSVPHCARVAQGSLQRLSWQTRLAHSLSALHVVPLALPWAGMQAVSSAELAALGMTAQRKPVPQSAFEVHARGSLGTQIFIELLPPEASLTGASAQ